MINDLSCNAGDMDLIPGLGSKIPHAVGQLSLCAAIRSPWAVTTELGHSATREKPTHHNEEPAGCDKDPAQPKRKKEKRSHVQPVHCPWNSPGKNTGVGSHSFLQRTFPTQGSNPDLPHCRHILYHLSHQRSPCIPLLLLLSRFSRVRLCETP